MKPEQHITINGAEYMKGWEEKMNLQKIFLIKFLILTLTLVIFSPCFSQVKKEGSIRFSGAIESISGDLESIVVNEVRIFISPGTTMVDEKENLFEKGALKLRDKVVVEASRTQKGLIAERIVVIKGKKTL